MNFKIENGNLHLYLNSKEQKECKYLWRYEPYCYNTHHNHYKQPLTRIALNNFINYFELNTPQLLNQLFNLTLINSFNINNCTQSSTEMLRPYQLQGVQWIRERRRTAHGLLLFWAMRTGKTRTACYALQHDPKIIILSLAGQETNWTSTFKFINDRQCFSLANKTKTQRAQIYAQFNLLTNAVLVGSVYTITQDIVSGLFKPCAYDSLIIDEIHKVKNPKTRLNKGCRLLRNLAQFCLGLTGTPTSKHINEILPIFALLLSNEYSKTYLSHYFFQQEYSAYTEYGVAGDVKPHKLNEWLEFFNMYVSQVNKEQALTWATTPSKDVCYLKFNPDQLKVYTDALYHMEIKRETEIEQISEVIAQITRLRQISTCPSVLEGVKCSNVKEEWLLNYFQDEQHAQEKIIVFSTFTSYLKQLYEKLKDRYKICMITGETKDKVQVAQAFQDNQYQIVLANIQAGSKGLTLDSADTMIFLDEDWKPDENQQAVERMTATTPDRIKLQQVIRLEIDEEFSINLTKLGSIDKYIHDVVEQKITKNKLINDFKEIFSKLQKQRGR